MKTVVLASQNEKKSKELSELLNPLGMVIQSQGALGVKEVEETGLTFVENALIKARHASFETGYPAIADDSGLVVDALEGAPGLYSSRYGGEPGNDEVNLQKVLHELKARGCERSPARYVCVIVYLKEWKDPLPIIAQGIWEGEVITTPRGQGGFGYDPIFWVASHECTAAELSPAVKNSLSHRGKAMADLLREMS